MENIKRDDLLIALYGATERSELLKQFDSYLTVNAKGTKNNQKMVLTQQLLFYSHAIIYNQRVQTANGWRQRFISTAKKNKKLNLSSSEVNEVFSFFNNTKKEKIVSAVPQKKQNNPTLDEIESLETQLGNKTCELARDEIKRLKAQLDNETYELAKGQKVEDKEIFIKVALVALSVGARLSEIMENLTVSTRKGVTYFNDGLKETEGVILELDTKTVQSYLKAIRSHYSDRIAKGTDISTGIRKAVKRLNIPKCQNTNNLNQLYKECLTSSTPK